ncbi:MAG: hypothetical protein KAV87_44795 [Desulfobacteraceae bacterium]|nr:hypothetical protein [Desulfobacteraceae bacterium]
MHTLEAEWIADKILSLPLLTERVRVLNVGSSTSKFRIHHQPHIDSFIFKPLREKGIEVVHQDIKEADGVDMVGDLTDSRFLSRLKDLECNLVLCNNLLEHLTDREPFLTSLRTLVPPGGYMVVTGPYEYPKHMDPIDTMYRPSINDLVALFPNMQLLDSVVIDVGTVWRSFSKRPMALIKLLLRVAIPFWRHQGWITAVSKLLWLFRKRTVACILLRNQ